MDDVSTVGSLSDDDLALVLDDTCTPDSESAATTEMYNFFTELIIFSYDCYLVFDRQSLDLSEDGSTSDNAETGALLDPAVSSGDFKRVLELMKQRQLTNNEKYHLLINHFKPSSTYQFPLLQYGKQKRSFQHSWLSCYNGLVYSELDKGGYCKYCVLFGRCAYSVTSFVGVLISCPLTNLQKASEKLREHFEVLGTGKARKYHLAAVQVAERFRAVMESKVIPIHQQLWNARAITIAKKQAEA